VQRRRGRNVNEFEAPSTNSQAGLIPVNTGESLRDKIYIPPPPTPNTLPNPNSYFCGYGYEAAINECYHACPGGSDAECPGGRYCYGWLTCDQSDVDPATYNVCGTSWGDAAKTCGGRCFLGDDDSCPTGQSCFGAVEECKDKLGPGGEPSFWFGRILPRATP